VTRVRAFAACVALAALTACGGPAVPPAANYGTVVGRVYDATTNQPVPGVLVTVDTILTSTSGSDGSYRIGTVPLGTYQVTVSPPSGYAAPNTGAAPYAGSIQAGQTVVVDIPLTRS
jgi:hypothetical protein